MKKRKLIIYELNEVPKKVLFDFIERYPNSTLKEIINKGIYLDTKTFDKGELHPWSTWPTVYRGVSNDIHSIKYINQDLTEINKRFPNVWSILEKNGIKIGIFGSLQSYPPLSSKNVKFYIPDTFSPKPYCHPSYLNIFQEFNLQLCSENKAITNKISLKSLILFFKLSISRRISLSCIIKIFFQIIMEKINPNYKKKRSFIQSIINFDFYSKLIKKNNIGFSTFFTNHVAATMHRYWKDAYDKSKLDLNKKTFNSNLINESMQLVDKQISYLYNFSKKNNYELWIISSMGQDSIDRGDYIPETILKSFNKLIKSLNLKLNFYELMPAMQPDICIKCKNKNALNKLEKSLENLLDLENNYLLDYRYKTTSLSINLSISTSISLSKNKKLKYRDQIYKLEDFGFDIINRDPGTAYHISDGIFIGNDPNNPYLKKFKNKTLNTSMIFNLILKNYGINQNHFRKLSK